MHNNFNIKNALSQARKLAGKRFLKIKHLHSIHCTDHDKNMDQVYYILMPERLSWGCRNAAKAMQCELQSKGKLKGKQDVRFDCGTETVVKRQ